MGDVSGRGPGPDAQIDLDALADLLADLDGGQASTRPVSIALPAPLADALRLLTESGVLTSTSAAASAELERLVRNLALRLSSTSCTATVPTCVPTRRPWRPSRAQPGGHRPGRGVTDVVLDAHGLTSWAQERPPRALVVELEAAQRDGGVVVVPTIAVVEATRGHPGRDARVNLRLKIAKTVHLTLPLARNAARLRAHAMRTV